MSASINLLIQELVPFESAAIRGVVDEKKLAIQEGNPPRAPRVVNIDHRYVVRNGNNTIVAYKELQQISVECELTHLPSGEQALFRDTIALREKKGQVGFQNFPVLPSEGDRTKLSLSEKDEMRQGTFFDALIQNLKPKSPP